MNVKLLKKVMAAIKKEPRQFDMASWFRYDRNIPNCKTSACIAGWALTCSAKKQKPIEAARAIRKTFGKAIKQLGYVQAASVEPEARKKLGITEDQSDILFHACDWPPPFDGQFFAADTHEEKAEVAITRIKHFIATNGAE